MHTDQVRSNAHRSGKTQRTSRQPYMRTDEVRSNAYGLGKKQCTSMQPYMRTDEVRSNAYGPGKKQCTSRQPQRLYAMLDTVLRTEPKTAGSKPRNTSTSPATSQEGRVGHTTADVANTTV